MSRIEHGVASLRGCIIGLHPPFTVGLMASVTSKNRGLGKKYVVSMEAGAVEVVAWP